MLRGLLFHASFKVHTNTHACTRAEIHLFTLRSGLKLVGAAAAAGKSVLEPQDRLSLAKQTISSPLHTDKLAPPFM